MKDLLGTNPQFFTIFEVEFWSPSITNLKYEQAQNYIIVNQQTKEESCFCQLLPFGFKSTYIFYFKMRLVTFW
jgi:hypothetical protein